MASHGLLGLLCRAIQFGIFDKRTIPFCKGKGVEMPDIPQTEGEREYARLDNQEGCHTGLYGEISEEHAKQALENGRNIVGLCHLAGNGFRKEAKVCSEFVTTVQALEKRECQNGKYFRICEFNPEGRSSIVIRFREGIQTFSFTPNYVGLVHFQVGRPLLSKHSTTLWMGALPPMVHTVSRNVRSLSPSKRVQSATISRRLFSCTNEVRSSFEQTPLCESCEGHRQCHEAARSQTPSHKRRMGRNDMFGTFRSADRYTKDDIPSNSKESQESEGPSQEITSDCKKRETLGPRKNVENFLRRLCSIDARNALGPVLHKVHILGYVFKPEERQTRKVPFESSECKGSSDVARSIGERTIGSYQLVTGWPMIPPQIEASIHTDAADLGYGATLNTQDMTGGVEGQWREQGVWNWQDRANSITYRELKTIRMILTGALGQELLRQNRKNLLLHIDNQAVVHITNSFVSASRPMMRELRRLKLVLDHLGYQIRSEWIPSVANKFADSLSRRFCRADLQIRRQVRRSVLDGMKAPIDAFPFRPLGEHPRFLRQQTFRELASEWDVVPGPFACFSLIFPHIIMRLHAPLQYCRVLGEWS